MNKDTLEGKWKQLKGKAQETWGKITNDEFDRMQGNSQQLAGLIQERYGKTKDQAEKEIRDFYDKYDR